MKSRKDFACCYVFGNIRHGMLFSIHESGTQIVFGDMADYSDEKRIKPLLFRQHIYLNPAKMMREYQEAGFEALATLYLREGGEYLRAVEMYRATRSIRGADNLQALLLHPDARPMLFLLLDMEGHDEESKMMQGVADEVYATLDNQTHKKGDYQNGHAS